MDKRDKITSDYIGFSATVDPLPLMNPEKVQEHDPILESIFVCDPVTGKPRSDLSLVYSANVSDDVKQYIRSTLQQTIIDSGLVAPDHETAEIMHRSPWETLDEYYTKVQNYVSSLNLESKSE